MSEAPLTLGEVVARTARYFANVGCPSPRLDADLLVAHALGLGRLELYTQFDRPLTPDELDRARALVARRGKREPVAYITGPPRFPAASSWRSAAVRPGPAPRDRAAGEWPSWRPRPTRRGARRGHRQRAIALALADERPDLAVTAIDASPAARAGRWPRNAAGSGLTVEFVHADGFAALGARRFDLVAANPPYLSEADYAAAPPELALRAASCARRRAARRRGCWRRSPPRSPRTSSPRARW